MTPLRNQSAVQAIFGPLWILKFHTMLPTDRIGHRIHVSLFETG